MSQTTGITQPESDRTWPGSERIWRGVDQNGTSKLGSHHHDWQIASLGIP